MARRSPTGHPTSPKALGDLLPESATCGHCNYSLRGLRSGGRCPECGTPIAFRARRHRLDDTITDAPQGYLKILATGCWLMFIGAFLTAGLLLMAWRLGGSALAPAFAGAAGITGVVWWAGVWIVTQPRRSTAYTAREMEAEWRRCRWVARLSQCGWAATGIGMCGTILSVRAAIAAAAMAVLPYSPTPTVHTFESIAGLGTFAGLVGIIPVCIVVASLADWAGASSLAERFRLSAWLVTLGTIGIVLTLPAVLARKSTLFGPVALVVYGIVMVGGAAFIFGMILLLGSLAQLASMSLWAIHNAATRSESDRRIAERHHQHLEEIGARSEVVTAIPPPEPDAAMARQLRAKRERHDPKTYALEPEEPGGQA